MILHPDNNAQALYDEGWDILIGDTPGTTDQAYRLMKQASFEGDIGARIQIAALAHKGRIPSNISKFEIASGLSDAICCTDSGDCPGINTLICSANPQETRMMVFRCGLDKNVSETIITKLSAKVQNIRNFVTFLPETDDLGVKAIHILHSVYRLCNKVSIKNDCLDPLNNVADLETIIECIFSNNLDTMEYLANGIFYLDYALYSKNLSDEWNRTKATNCTYLSTIIEYYLGFNKIVAKTIFDKYSPRYNCKKFNHIRILFYPPNPPESNGKRRSDQDYLDALNHN